MSLHPDDYPHSIVLVGTEHGNFMAFYKTQVECYRFYRDNIRGGRNTATPAMWRVTLLNEETASELYDQMQSTNSILE